MSISGVSSGLSALAAAQTMFGPAAQAASAVSAGGDASASEAIQVALLQKTLAAERSLVNILA